MTHPPDSLPPNRSVHTLTLLADVLAAPTVEAAANRLVQSLARAGPFDRVSMGIHTAGQTRLMASSSLSLKPQSEHDEVQLAILGALDEAIAQSITLTWPKADASKSPNPAILFEHHVLYSQVGGVVATVPFGINGEPIGAVCFERRSGDTISPAELAVLEQQLALLAPALQWMVFGTQTWPQRTRRALQDAWTQLRHPKRTVLRRIILVGISVIVALAVIPMDHYVGGRARIEGAQQRVLSAPSDGFVKAAYVRPGDRVKAGAALVDLLEEDYWLQRTKLESQVAQHENAYAAAMAGQDRVGAATSMARISEVQAQLALIQEQLIRGRLSAPFDGLVVQGDLTQSIGAAVNQGDPLITLASTDSYRVIIDIDEIEIAQVRPGQTGELMLSSWPWDSWGVQVRSITPLAKASDGHNVFETEAYIPTPPDHLRPGLVGRVDIKVGRTPLLWVWGRKLLDRLRMTYWTWLG